MAGKPDQNPEAGRLSGVLPRLLQPGVFASTGFRLSQHHSRFGAYRPSRTLRSEWPPPTPARLPACRRRSRSTPAAPSSPRPMPLIPHGVMRDIVTSYLPHWSETRAWVIARPMTGFSETFSQYIMEVFPGGGSERPEPNPEAEGVLFVVEGLVTLVIDGKSHMLRPGGYAFLPPGCNWTLSNKGDSPHPLPLGAQALRGRRRHRHPGRLRRQRAGRADHLDARHQEHLGHHPLRRSHRRAPRHARQHRHARARRRHPVRGNPRHGARPLRARGQGRLPAQPRLGRGRGRRFHVAARLLPAGLLRRPRTASATCSTRTSTATRSCRSSHDGPHHPHRAADQGGLRPLRSGHRPPRMRTTIRSMPA